MSDELAAIEARYWDWYCSDDACCPHPAADWSARDVDGDDIEGGESMDHCIVRNDVPWLMDEVKRLRLELSRIGGQS